MKRVILFIILFFSALMFNAQVMNNNGEKVIRKIEVYAETSLKPYAVMAFNYNNDLELEEIVVNIHLTCKFRLKKQGNTISRSDYRANGVINNKVRYQYSLKGGLVNDCQIDNIGVDNSVLRFDYKYCYDNDGRLKTINKFEYFREENNSFKELSDRYKEIFEWDEKYNVYTTGENGWNWKLNQEYDYNIQYKMREYYADLHNETNIDLSKLCLNITDYNRIETVTEWFGKHSKHYIESNNNYYFEIIYGNSNVSEIVVYSPHKYVEKKYKIYYWED